MSQLRSGARQLEYKIRQFRGVNENADGDANLKAGEAAVMRNYRITDGGALKVRPGYVQAIPTFAPSSSLHIGNEKQAATVYQSGQEITFYGSATVSNNQVQLSSVLDTLDLRSASARQTLEGYGTAYFYVDEVPYKFSKIRTATGISGNTACYVYGNKLTVDKGIAGLWSGMVAGNEVMLFARENKLYSQQFDAEGNATVTATVGTIDTSGHVEIFFFGDKVYVLDGNEYYSWDGTTFGRVEGYIPTVAVAVSPSGDGTLLEQINTLVNKIRVKFSSNGTATKYKFNSGFSNTLATEVYINGEKLSATSYEADFDGSITFNTAPQSGSSNIDVIYTYVVDDYQNAVFSNQPASAVGKQFKVANNGATGGISKVQISRGVQYIDLIDGADYSVSKSGEDYVVTLKVALQSGDDVIIGRKLITNRNRAARMRYAEFFNGAADTRVFLYGDGTNKAIYSDVMGNGKGSAEYFPDLNEMQVGDANTPITSMIRHHNRLLAFKRGGGAYSIYYGQLSLADGSITAGFYISNINKIIGCDGYDAATLVMNNPRTLEKGSIYEWQATSRSGNITQDQRNAEVVSERIHDTLRGFDMENAMTYYDVRRHEYYCVYNGVAVVNNTLAKAWYIYTNFPATCMTEYGRQLYFGTADGLIYRVDENATTDNGEAIEAYWESGSLDFGRPNDVKYTPKVWVSALPETNAKVTISIDTDNGSSGDVELAFEPHSVMAKTLKANLKARKFTYYKLKMTAADSGKHATVLSAVVKASYDIPVKR